MTGLTLRGTTPAILGRNAFDHLFDQFFNDPGPMIKRSTDGYPLTDIYKDDAGNQIIEMALAGFSKEDIQIESKENTISITFESMTKGDSFANRRIARRSFSKKFVDYHNQLNFQNTTATFENGLLRITIPLREEVKSVIININ